MAKIIQFHVGTEQKITDKMPDGSFRSIMADVGLTVGLEPGDEANLDALVKATIEWTRAARRAIILPVLKEKDQQIASIYLGLPPDALAMMGLSEEQLRVYVTNEHGVETDVSAEAAAASTKESK